MADEKGSFEVRTNGATLAARACGEGPPLLWLPGAVASLALQASLTTRQPQIDALASFARLIQFDRRGQGLTNGEPAKDIERELADIEAVREAIGTEQIAILGESLAGGLGALYAATYPERVSHLVLYGAMACNALDPAAAESRPLISDRGLEIAAADPVTFCLRTAQVITSRSDQLTMLASYMQAAAAEADVRAAFATFQRIDLRPVAGRITAPTLVIHARDDRAVPVAHGRFYAGAIPGARYVEREADDHLVYLDRSGVVLTTIRAFLTGTPARGRRPSPVIRLGS